MENFRSQSMPSTPESTVDSASNLPSLVLKEPHMRGKLRRNSISLPALINIDLDELQKLQLISIEVRTSNDSITLRKRTHN